MTRIFFIAHSETADGGRLRAQLQRRGYQVQLIRPCLGQPLPAIPAVLDDLAGCVVLGGPMSANDDHLPAIAAELDWLSGLMQRRLPLMGICLGAQLIARVLGARVWDHPAGEVEVGFHRVEATPAGRALFEPHQVFYQWHRQGFDHPPGTELLATAARFENQAFRYRDHALGFQFHPELTAHTMRRWLANGRERLGLPGAQPPAMQWRAYAHHQGRIEGWLARLLDCWLQSDEQPRPLVPPPVPPMVPSRAEADAFA